ncbi:MAG TPA: hypothetical protein VMV32_05835, partial [Ignavibacteriaceae bacterium]|nr:hypothetical protein [Ignavibacteriaceae bacterium]
VNIDLTNRGVRFIMDTSGRQLIDWDELQPEDIVIIPAFGTTIEIQNMLKDKGIDPYRYNTTCPFVEKVWNRSVQLGNENCTIIIHGKHNHEETRATFSHSVQNSPALIVRDLKEAGLLSSIILGERDKNDFYKLFAGKYSEKFDIENELVKIGVVNQTTMLASETEAIANLLRETMIKKYGIENLKEHFVDTRDTLCYATYDNQEATYGLLEEKADFAIVVGGYNSSNTSHIVELCEEKLETYFISSEEKIISSNEIKHYNFHSKQEIIKINYLPMKNPVDIILTSGASCPDAVVDRVLQKILSFFNNTRNIEEVITEGIIRDTNNS